MHPRKSDHSMRRITFLFLLASFCIHAEPPPDQWYTVLLDGRKIGSFESTREVREGRVITAQTLNLSIERAGTPVALISKETSEETPDGQPLAFRSESKLSGSETTVEGTV